MARSRIDIPIDDLKINIKGLRSLLKEGKTQNEMVIYYSKKGINVDQATISRRLKELNDNKL